MGTHARSCKSWPINMTWPWLCSDAVTTQELTRGAARQVHKIYRTTGASMSKAQAEFTSGVMRNETVQSATADFAANAVRSQMQQPGGAGDRRF